MAGIRQVDWEDIIHETALNAADAWRKYLEANGSKVDDAGEKNTYEKVFSRLMQEYPYENATMDTMKALYDYKPETVWRWVINGTTDPRKEREALEASKFLPYLMGHEKDWTKTPTKALQEMATNDLKYPYTKEGYSQFLRELGAQQVKADRAKVLKELRSMPQYYAALAAYPSLVEAIDNAVATGKDIDDSEVAKLMALDAGTDIAQVAAPGIREFKYVNNPYVNTGIGAGLQGIAEAVRQYGKNGIDENLTPEQAPIIAATTLGATRPGMVGTTQAYASQFQGPAAQNFSRGVMRALKMGDPMDLEKQRMAKLAAKYNMLNAIESAVMKNSESNAEKIATRFKTPNTYKYNGVVLPDVSIAEGNANLSAGKILDIAKALGVDMEPNGMISPQKLLDAYEKSPRLTQKLLEGKIENVSPEVARLRPVPDGVIRLTPEQEQLYKSYLTAKYTFEDGASRARTAGLLTGKILGDYGGRIEPVLKGNPFGSSYNGNVKDYRKEAWYRKLSEEQRKVIDDAMKEKEEE